MSREQLVDGYASGRIGRRAFVKGLAALGVTGAAAVAYADALAASPAPRGAGSVKADLYDLYPPSNPTPPTEAAGAGAARPIVAAPTFTG